MARYLCPPLIVLVLLLSGGSEAAAPAAAAADPAQGDVTCDSAVNSIDSLQILRSVAGLSTSAACLADAGDVNCDGAVNSVDSLRILRYVAELSNTTPDGCAAIGDPLAPPPTSEELIAAALDAGEITYEESLWYRALALYDDPRLPDEYASPIINWEAAGPLFVEVDANEAQLSPGLLADLAPFRARPNDPISIFNNPPAASGAAVAVAGPPWQSFAVPGTNARVWLKTDFEFDLELYVDLVNDVWSTFGGNTPGGTAIFTYPNPDLAEYPNPQINPDSMIDFYFIDGAGIDPRRALCLTNPQNPTCLLAGNQFAAVTTKEQVGNKSSGYVIVDEDLSPDDLLYGTAFALAMASEYAYDNDDTDWLRLSTAEWAAYHVMKELGNPHPDSYARLHNLYPLLGETLDISNEIHNRGSWLFMEYASRKEGNSIVETIWQQAAPLGQDGILAVDRAFALDEYFDDFTLTNWITKWPEFFPASFLTYDEFDRTWPSGLRPPFSGVNNAPPVTYVLDPQPDPLAAQYYQIKFAPEVRRVTFENLLYGVQYAHIWAITKIGSTWQEPEDWTGSRQKLFCRDNPQEDLTAIVLIVSNADGQARQQLPVDKAPRLIADAQGCPEIRGWAETTITVQDGDWDMTFTSGRVNLVFKPRAVQPPVGGVVEYELMPGTMTWTASGTIGDCTAFGLGVVDFLNPDPDLLAWGYMHVVGPQDGDWHGLLVSANTPGTYTVTCPNQFPYPYVYEEGFRVGFLLQILSWPNAVIPPDRVAYKGQCETPDLPPPALVCSGFSIGPPGTRQTFKWDLRPATQPAPP